MRLPIKIQVDKDLNEIERVNWYKKEGDKVTKEEPVAHIETQKADVDVGAPENGILVKIVIPHGEPVYRPNEIPTGSWDALLGWIETEVISEETLVRVRDDERVRQETESRETPSSARPKEKIRVRIMPDGRVEQVDSSSREATGIEIVKEVSRNEDATYASPMVRRVARERGIGLLNLRGTGPHGMVTLEDLNRIESRPESNKAKSIERPLRDDRIETFGIIRQAIAKHMQESWNCIPHAGSWIWLNFANFFNVKSHLKHVLSHKFGVLNPEIYLRPDVFLIEGILRELENEGALLNSCYGCAHEPMNQWKENLKVYGAINLGIAYDDPKGLLVPVLHGLEGSRYRTIAERLEELYGNLREGKLKRSDFVGGTFTFNNVGVLGGDGGESIITHGQSSIVSLHRIETDPSLPLYGRTVLSLRFDHRAYDGGLALRFLQSLKRFIEKSDTEIDSHILNQFQKK